jgi:electron transport complex protein RnfB
VSNDAPVTRRDLLKHGGRVVAVAAAALGLGTLTGDHGRTVWQIDPDKCMQCGRCARNCVLSPSAVKAVHAFALCGYCDLCTGFFEAQPASLDTGAENQNCPAGAIVRRFVEDPYFQYTIDESKCLGCAKCVKGCGAYGNGSLFLQIRHDRCVNCNQCAISSQCPAQAIARVPADKPYLIKTKPGKA